MEIITAKPFISLKKYLQAVVYMENQCSVKFSLVTRLYFDVVLGVSEASDNSLFSHRLS